MKFIYLDSGAIYCWWGKSLKDQLIIPLQDADAILKGEVKIDVKPDWFVVWDPAYQHARWTP